MKKLFNSRPIFVGVISLIISIITVGSYLMLKSTSALIFLVLLCLSFVTMLAFVVTYLLKRKFSKIISLVFSCVFILIGSVGSLILLVPQNKELSGEQNIVGVVSGITNYSNSSVIELDDVKINNNPINCKISINCYGTGESTLVEGKTVEIVTELVAVTKTYNNVYYISENIGYTANCYLTSIKVLSGDSKFDLRSYISKLVKQNLDKFLNETNSAIAYSALFGIKDGMPTETYNMFSYAGIAHILAVSGLHIGFLVSVLSLVLKVLKCNKNVKNIILIALLVFYAYLCNFTASVTRAVIMSIVLLLSKSYAKEYDSLNSLSLAAIIILLFSPFSIFAKGFQLSFMAVFSIITLSKPIENFLAKIKCPEKLNETISMSLSVNLGLLCISAQHFNQINLISIFSNIIVIPIFSSCFCLMFLTSFLGLLLPFLNYLLIIPNMLLHFIKLIANVFANITFLNFDLFKFSYVFVGLFILFAYIFHFALVSKNLKRIVCSAIILVITISALVLNVPANINYNLALTSQTLQGNYVLVGNNKDNLCLVLNGVTNANNITQMLNNKNISKINSIVLNNYGVNQNEMLEELINKYHIKNLYVSNFYYDFLLENFGNVSKINNFNNSIVCNGVNMEILEGFKQDNFGVKITFDGYTFLLINSNAKTVELNNYFLIENNFDFVIANNCSSLKNNYNFTCEKLIDDNSVQILQGENLFGLS